MRNSFNLLCGLLVFAALPVPDQDEVGVPGSDLLPAIRTQLIQRVLPARSRNCARDFDLVLSEQGSLLGEVPEKRAYAIMRDATVNTFRKFRPDIATHVQHQHSASRQVR